MAVLKLRGAAAIGLAVAMWLLAGTSALPARPAPAAEYQLKAVFLFNFTQFVEWPRDAFSDGQAPLVIGILGTDPFGGYLDETVRGEKVHNRPLVVRRYGSVAEIESCHVLFISRSEAPRLQEILARLRGRSILTVGDAGDFAENGGMIGFVSAQNKIRLRINLDAVKAAGLTISSKLLRAADTISARKG